MAHSDSQSRIPAGLRQQADGPRWSRSRGSIIWDDKNDRYLDMSGGFGVAAIGHSRPELAIALQRQADTLVYAMTGVFPHAYEEPTHRKIAELTGFGDSGSVIITTSGTEAVDLALRVALRITGRPRMLAFGGGYHGQTLGTLGVIGQDAFRLPFRASIGFDTDFFAFPGLANAACAETLDAVKACLSVRRTAAVIIEPMQNIAGFQPIDQAAFVALRQLCTQYGTILICDEIFTGFGRTGAWSLTRALGVRPDLLCVGKAMTGGVPAGACVSEPSLLRGLDGPGKVPLHAPTFFATPLITAGVGTTINILESEGLVHRARYIGERLTVELGSSLADLGAIARGVGAAVALDFSHLEQRNLDQFMNAFGKALLHHRIIALRSGFPRGSTIALSPPLVMTDNELDEAVIGIVAAAREAAMCLP
jgi:acetylornithine/succinyldiaminopimelate/putrescine aminotransferase